LFVCLEPKIEPKLSEKSSKNILRKARLQLNKKTLLKIRKPESFQNLFQTSIDSQKTQKLVKTFERKRLETKTKILNKY
jgi:hypothetical protein